jgi:hypothetical protein
MFSFFESVHRFFDKSYVPTLSDLFHFAPIKPINSRYIDTKPANQLEIYGSPFNFTSLISVDILVTICSFMDAKSIFLLAIVNKNLNYRKTLFVFSKLCSNEK